MHFPCQAMSFKSKFKPMDYISNSIQNLGKNPQIHKNFFIFSKILINKSLNDK